MRTPSQPEEQAGPILITYNGLSAALRALVLATRVLAERRTPLVVWGRGLGRELLEVPLVPGLPPARIDIRAACCAGLVAARAALVTAQAERRSGRRRRHA